MLMSHRWLTVSEVLVTGVEPNLDRLLGSSLSAFVLECSHSFETRVAFEGLEHC